MHLSVDQITITAMDLLRSYGLADVSMRRIAKELDVAPSALYWHVPSKQNLIARLAEHIVAPVTDPSLPIISTNKAAAHLRDCLLNVRDGAEVTVTAVGNPESPIHSQLQRFFITSLAGDVEEASIPQLEATADALLHLVLGSALVQQTELQLVTATKASESFARSPVGEREKAFAYSVDLLVRGLQADC